MFTKVRTLKVLVVVAILMLVSTVAVVAAVECHFVTFSTKDSAPAFGAKGLTVGSIVTDTLTIAPSYNPGLIQGTLTWFACGPASGTTVPVCTSSYVTQTQVGLPQTLNYTVPNSPNPPSSFSRTSPNFIPTKVGNYCFRVVFTQTGGIFPSAMHVGGDPTQDPNKAECFTVSSSSTAVTLSSFSAQSDALDVNNLAVPGVAAFAGLLALVGLLGAGYVVRARS